MTKWFEVNFDGLVGPTHHYGGLGIGNLASQQNRHAVSRPREAALEGLAKMKLLADLGLKQAVLPPHPRPHWACLKSGGLTGEPSQILKQAAAERPDLLSMAYSSAFMWTANAATVSPSLDTADGRVHFTPANLLTTPHRRLEAEFTTRLLRHIFHNEQHFLVHDPLAGESRFADEGAANHTRLSPGRHVPTPGIELFVYGRDAENSHAPHPERFVARQTRQASQWVAAFHQLDPSRTLFVQQTPEAIDAGVFHNDVIAVGNENVLLCHERAFVDQPHVLTELQHLLENDLFVLQVRENDLPLTEAVRTYLFNSQLLTLPTGEMLLVCPSACAESPQAKAVIDRWISDRNPIAECRFVDVEQSLRNGGGPACLRLRVLLNDSQLAAIQGRLMLTSDLYRKLCEWVRQHYREELTVADLADPQVAEEVAAALKDLAKLLKLPPDLFANAAE